MQLEEGMMIRVINTKGDKGWLTIDELGEKLTEALILNLKDGLVEELKNTFELKDV